MIRVFVYGTLKRGQRNAHFLGDASYLGPFVTDPVYRMYEFDDYPAVCLHGRRAIQGEVYRINEHQFRTLDDLEWYPSYYQRIEIPTEYGDAWMYIVDAKLCRGRKQIAGVWPRDRGA